MTKRTTQGLRDLLFDEIEELRTGKGEPRKSQAVANLARQIIGTAKIEIDFIRTIAIAESSGKKVSLGHIALGSERQERQSPAQSAPQPVMGH